MNDDRAATEVLGYVLVISLTTVLIAIVMTTGMSGIEDSQQAEQLNNMERAFDVLDHNLNEIPAGGVETRSTEVRLGEGALGHGERVNISVTADGDSIGGINRSEMRPIVYRQDRTEIAYLGGAVIRDDDGNARMLNSPGHSINDSRTTMRIVLTEAGGEDASGDGTALIRATERNRGLAIEEPLDTVNITIEETDPDRADAWESYFEGFENGTTTRPLDRTVVVSVDTDEVRIHWVIVEISYH